MTKFKTIYVTDAIGPVLDWLVARCEGLPLVHNPFGADCSPGYWVHLGGIVGVGYRKCGGKYSPSTDWAQGGPIIARERIDVIRYRSYGDWGASIHGDGGASKHGPTVLIAAMRCYVTSKLGEQVEVPEELCQ